MSDMDTRQAMRDFGSMPVYPPAGKSQSLFAATAARTWNAGSSSTNNSSTTYTSTYVPHSLRPVAPSPRDFLGPPHSSRSARRAKEFHHKKSSFAIGAKFKPALWEDPQDPEQKVEKELNTWTHGWATDRANARYRVDNPYIRSSGASSIRTPADELEVLARQGHGARISELVGEGVAFPLPHAAGTRSTGCQTESWGEYGSAVTRIHELGAQVKHLAKVNANLEKQLHDTDRSLDQATLDVEELRSSHASLSHELEVTRTTLESLTAEYDLLRNTREEHVQELELLRAKTQSQKQHIASQDNVIAQYMADKDKLILARQYDALEVAKVAILQEEMNTLLNEKNNHDQAYAHALELNAQHQSTIQELNSRNDSQKKSLEASARLLDEHVRQSSLDSQHLHQMKSGMDLKLADKDNQIKALEAEIERLKKAEEEQHPSHPKNQAVAMALAQSQANVEQLTARNDLLSKTVIEREKMINDLLTSSVYRKEVLVKKEKAIPPDERARMQKEKEEADKNKSKACVVM